MKRMFITAGCIMISVCIMMCKKSSQGNNTTCTNYNNTPLSHPYDTSGVCYFLPTAFTPNGDGINDVFGVFYSNLDTANSSLTILDMGGTEVFTGKINRQWGGADLNGNKCSAGQYRVYAQLKTKTGATINACTFVNILAYSGSCIKTNGITYYFPDQLDSAGFMFTTNDQLCP